MDSPDASPLDGDPGVETGLARNVRLMTEADLSAIIALDKKTTGRARTVFYEEKMAACLREPAVNTSLVAEVDGAPVGFLMGQLFFGEFGIPAARAVLDAFGVHPMFRRNRIGETLMAQYQRNLTGLRVEAIDTLVDWDQVELLAFFRAMGFHPSRSVDLVWDVANYPFAGSEGAAHVRLAKGEDLAAVATIDFEGTLLHRPSYLQAKLEHARAEPERNVFLVAEVDGQVAGFMMGGLYLGEFGIDITRGVIDSFGVKEEFRHRGVASAIMEYLLGLVNRSGVTQMETLCRWNEWELLQFFEYVGFRPSARINLERPLTA